VLLALKGTRNSMGQEKADVQDIEERGGFRSGRGGFHEKYGQQGEVRDKGGGQPFHQERKSWLCCYLKTLEGSRKGSWLCNFPQVSRKRGNTFCNKGR